MRAAAGLGLASVDVSQAFLQSGNVAVGDKYLIEIPDYIAIPWQEKLNPHAERGTNRPEAFLMHRSSYGLRESPLRWFIHLSKTLRAGWFRQLGTDICLMITYRNGFPRVWLLCYVDDILIGYYKDGLGVVKRVLSVYRTGEYSVLSRKLPIQFIGLDIEMSHEGGFLSPRNPPHLSTDSY